MQESQPITSNITSLQNVRNINAAADKGIDLYFPVASYPVAALRPDDNVNSLDYQAIVREDTNQILAVHKQDYKLVPNDKVFPAFEGALKKSHLDLNGMRVKDSLSYGGGRCERAYFFPEHRVTIKTGDELEMQLRVVNSYDGSSAFQSMVGAFRLVCSNGMVIGNKFAQHFGKHTAGLDIDMVVRKMDSALYIYLEEAEMWQGWMNARIDDNQATAMFKKLAGANDSLIDHLDLLWKVEKMQLGATKWALFNVLTNWSTHHAVKKSSAQNKSSIVLGRESKVRKLVPAIEALNIAA